MLSMMYYCGHKSNDNTKQNNADNSETSVKTTDEPYIAITVKRGISIELGLAASNNNITVKITGGQKDTTVNLSKELKNIEYVSHNDNKSIIIYGNVTTFELHRTDKKIEALDVSHNLGLKKLVCIDVNLSNLDVSKNVALKHLDCQDNKLGNLDIGKNINLTYLDCSSCELSNLDISKNTALQQLDVISNKLTQLDLSKNKKLRDLSCDANELGDIDVSKNAALQELTCDNAGLKSLDLSKNTELHLIYVTYNPIAKIPKNILALFMSLPDRSNKESGTIRFADMEIDDAMLDKVKKEAKDKNWKIEFEDIG